MSTSIPQNLTQCSFNFDALSNLPTDNAAQDVSPKQCDSPCNQILPTTTESSMIEERFWRKVDKDGENGCWLWTAGAAGTGNRGAMFDCAPRSQRYRKLAHHYSFELVNGPIPQYCRIIHTCSNVLCVNPAHLKLQTKEEVFRETIKNKPIKTAEEQFFCKVDKDTENGCWLWKDTMNNKGTGVFRYQDADGKWAVYSAHRFAYKQQNGSIPIKGKIMQSCGIKHCVNPDHLQLFNGSLEERFWSKVQKQDGDNCWLWTAKLNETGYGQFNNDGTKKAHRVSYELAHGAIPDGLCVCHKCDNPKCVRPDHLFLGTLKDNMRDCANKGRIRIPKFLGETVPNAKFKNDEVREIKQMIVDGCSDVDIMGKFPKVKKNDILSIKAGRTWGHIA